MNSSERTFATTSYSFLGTVLPQRSCSIASQTPILSPEQRKTATGSDDIAYEMRFTRDKGLIAAYKELRRRLYKNDPRLVGFRIFNDDDAENYEDDPDDQVLILHDGRQCYGGACLRISTPRHPVILDLEQDILPHPGTFYFSLKEHLSDMDLDTYSYCEFNRIILDPRLRKGEATRRMFQAVLERCLQYHVRYMFGIGDKVRIRLYRQIYTNMGMDCHIRHDIDIPMRKEYEGMKMQLLGGDMKKLAAAANPGDASLLVPLDDFPFS